MSKKHQEWELAGLLEALGETAPHESWLAGLTGLAGRTCPGRARELTRKKLIRLENGWIRREPWPESLARCCP